MDIHLTPQGVITLSSLIAAIVAIFGYIFKARDWVKRQEAQDAEIKALKEEQQLLTYGVLACLKGLKEQGCNGPVTEAITKIEKHLNEKAHH